MRLINPSVYYQHHQHPLLSPPPPPVSACILLHLHPSTSTSLCSPEPALHLPPPPLLPKPPSFFHPSLEMLSSSFLHLLFLLSLLQSESSGISSLHFPGQSCNYSSREKKTSCFWRNRFKSSGRKRVGRPSEAREGHCSPCLPYISLSHQSAGVPFSRRAFLKKTYQTGSRCSNRNYNPS